MIGSVELPSIFSVSLVFTETQGKKTREEDEGKRREEDER